MFAVIIVFFLTFTVFQISPITTSYDSRWSIFVAKSIYSEGNINLNEYESVLDEHGFYGICEYKGNYYNYFPIGTPLLATPFVFISDLLGWPVPEGKRHLEKLIASIFAALSAVFVFLVVSKKLKPGTSLLLVGTYAFATSIWSTSTRALWQHGPSALMLAIALFILSKAEDDDKMAQYASLPLVFGFFIRPTNAIPLVIISIYTFFKYRKYFKKFVFWGFMMSFPFIAQNLITYDTLLPIYYLPKRLSKGGSSTFLEALVANLISPSRGLFVFSPVLLFSIYGIYKSFKNPKNHFLNFCLSISILIHWIAISKFSHWWGGLSYGPRFFCDLMPFFALLLVPFMKDYFESAKGKRVIWIVCFLVLLGWSVFVNFRGATTWDVYEWHNSPVSVEIAPERIWDLSDPQFLR